MEITIEILNEFNETHDDIYSDLEKLEDEVYNEIFYWYNSKKETAEAVSNDYYWYL